MTETENRLREALADRYAIQRELGAGGMATVYLAEDVRHRRQVAVKVLRSDIAQTLGAERFVREIEIAAQLHHPHILPLLDSGEADGFLYYVMPYVEGESLRSKLDREHELPVQEAIRILYEVVDGLAKAHGRGVVHRDIKPDNVLLSDGHAAVADFGVAKAVSEATGGGKITTAGIALGTPAYMAPEQAVADPHVDHRADLYAVGVMAYEMLAGRAPFEGSTPQAILGAQVTQAPDRVSQHREAVPESLASLVARCLEKKPADRFQSAEDLRAELAKLATPSGGTIPVTGVAPPPPSRTRAPLIATGAVVVLAALGGWWMSRDSGSTVVGSAERIAVIPFAPTVADSSLFRLGRDMVVLLSRNLDGVGDVTVVDASTVLARISDNQQSLSLEDAATAARGLGAGSFVHGRFVRTGDDVILDVTLNESGDRSEIGRASVRADENDIVALTDSVTWALLSSVWQGADAPTPSLGAVTTRSLVALRAFLDGERAIANGQWLRAPELFREAFEADTAFLLAYFRHWEGRSWLARSTDQAIIDRLERDRRLLPERERLLVDARFAPDLEARLEIGRELTDRFPDYWPGWLEYGDRIVHYAPYLGYRTTDAMDAFQRVVQLNRAFQPGWEHVFYIELWNWNLDAATRALDTLAVLAGSDDSFYGADFFTVSRAQVAAQADELELTNGQIDSLARRGIEFAREVGDPRMAAFWVPSAEGAVPVIDRVMELTNRPEELNAALGVKARALAGIGSWSAALDAAAAAVARDDTPATRILAYKLAVTGALLEALPRDVIEEWRPVELRTDSRATPRVRAEITWWDGVVAYLDADRTALAQVRRGLEAVELPQVRYLDSSLAAFDMALAGRELDAARILESMELDAANATWREDRVHAAMINRFLAASWFLANDRPGDADRILRHTEAAVPNPEVLGSLLTVWSVSNLQRGRAAEAAGRNQDAVDFFNRFLVMYAAPDSSHQHLRDEAEAALARLSAETNR